jgi:predicted dehydrogenase
MPLRIGMVGCGAMGMGHLSVWKETPGAVVGAVCDPNPATAQRVSGELGVRGFTELEEMLDSGLIDAVDIVTPSGMHADQGMAAASRGIHVFVEKPIDLNLSKAQRLVDLCSEKGVTLGAVFQRRTYAGAARVARDIAEGRLGRLLSVSAHIKWWRSDEYYASGAWRGTWALDGGVLSNQAVHAIDHMCWLAGSVEEVEYAHCSTEMHRMEAEDNAIAVLRFSSGARGVIEATTCCNPPLASRIEVYGTLGSAAFEDATVVKYGIGEEDLTGECRMDAGVIGGHANPMAISLAGHAALARDFVEAVREGRDPMVPGREALKAVEALHKIYRRAFSNLVPGTP